MSPRQSTTPAAMCEGATRTSMQVSDMLSPMSNSVVAPMPKQSISWAPADSRIQSPSQAPADSPTQTPTQVAAVVPRRRIVAAKTEVAWEDQSEKSPQDRRPSRRQRAEQSSCSPSRARLRRHMRDSPERHYAQRRECNFAAAPATGQVVAGEALNNADRVPSTSKAKRPGTSHAIDVLVLPKGQAELRSKAEDVYSAWGSPTNFNRRRSHQDLLPGCVETETPQRAGDPDVRARLRTGARAREPTGQAMVETQGTWAWQREPGGPLRSRFGEDGRLRTSARALQTPLGDQDVRLQTASRAPPSRNGQTPAGRQDGPLSRHRQLRLQGGALQTAGQLITEL